MQSRTQHEQQTAAAEGDSEYALANELRILRDVFRMLPTGVTVQDEQGRFLLVNDAAAAQLGMAGSEMEAPASKELDYRRKTGMELLRTGSQPLRRKASTATRPDRSFSPPTGRSVSRIATCCCRVPPTSANRRPSRIICSGRPITTN